MALVVKNLSASYGDTRVLWDVSLEVGDGEVVALIGSNGAGKSTFLGAVSGLVHIDAGSVEYQGKELAGQAPDRIVRAGVVQVPQGRRLFSSLTVRENLLMGAYARRAKAAEIAGDLDDVFALFPALVRYRDATAGSLSGGEQQMVAVGRALMAKPDLLLLDEPSLGLAPKVRAEIFGALARLAERGVTILLVEQNLRLAARICQRAYLMQRGRIVGTETSAELAQSARHVYLESHG